MAAAAAPEDTKMTAAAEEASAMDPPAIAYIQPLEADPQYSSMYLPSYEALPEIVPWPGWPEQAEPPEDWEPLPDLPPIEEVICHPHHLPTVGHFQLCCGPPFPWPKLLGPKKPPDLSEPVREYLMAKIHKLLLEGMKLIVIERPERPIDFLAKYLRSENPLACKIKCRRHSGATCYCKVVVDLPPPPPPPPPKKKKKEDEEEEEAAW